MKDKMLKICKEVLKEDWTSNKSLSCSYIDCKKCLFGGADDCCDMDTNSFKQLAKEYISKYEEELSQDEPKFKVGDIVTGVNSSQWAYGGKYKISKLSVEDEITKYGLIPMDNNTYCYPGCVWFGEELELVEYDNDDSDKDVHSVNKKMFKELIAEWDGIKEGDIWESEHFIIEKDFQKDIKITHKEGFGGCSAISINPNYIFTLQKPLTLDDFEIGEEFLVEGFEDKFIKINVFNEDRVVHRNDGRMTINRISDFKDSKLIKIKGDK